MHVGLITSWDRICGVAEYSSFLVSALRKRGIAVTVLTHYPEAIPPASQPDPDVVAWFHTLGHKLRGYDVDLALRTLDERQVDLLHIQFQSAIYPGPFDETVPLLAWRRPLIATFHDASTFVPDLLAGAIFHNRRTANATVAQGVHVDRQRIIPHGIYQGPRRSQAEARQRLGIGAAPVLCTCGMTGPQWETILDLLPALTTRWPNLLYLVLNPQPRSWLWSELERRGLQSSVRLTEWLPLPELMLHLQAADVLVLYYKERGVECSSGAARLAIGSGRPTVLSDVTQMWDLPDALKVPFGQPGALQDRICRLLEDHDFAAANAASGQTLAAADNWDRTAARHADFYEEILAAAQTGPNP